MKKEITIDGIKYIRADEVKDFQAYAKLIISGELGTILNVLAGNFNE